MPELSPWWPLNLHSALKSCTYLVLQRSHRPNRPNMTPISTLQVSTSDFKVVATTGTNHITGIVLVSCLNHGGMEHDPGRLNIPTHHQDVLDELLEVGDKAPSDRKLQKIFPTDSHNMSDSSSSSWVNSLEEVVIRWWSVDSSSHLITRVSKKCVCRSNETTTLSIVELNPKSSWCQEHIWTHLCFYMMFAVGNPWLTQKSNNTTHVQIRGAVPPQLVIDPGD